MEHLKLFSARLNIPRLIRVCEDFHHWKELVFLYIQYDEYDNAALVMMKHSPSAWEHVLFKDVAVKVSNVEVYYKAISFYLENHPDLLVDLLKVTPLPCLLLSCLTINSPSTWQTSLPSALSNSQFKYCTSVGSVCTKYSDSGSHIDRQPGLLLPISALDKQFQ